MDETSKAARLLAKEGEKRASETIIAVDVVEFKWTAGEIEEKELRLRASMERARRVHMQLEIISNIEIYIASHCFTFFCPMHDQGLGERELDG
ncbi:hypothetical protein FOH38_00935 [Lysinibacillus fusiformis]|nr:hypothetical protein FOH38_00935 [Lysinibacillus fusiformis]